MSPSGKRNAARLPCQAAFRKTSDIPGGFTASFYPVLPDVQPSERLTLGRYSASVASAVRGGVSCDDEAMR